MKNGLRVKMFFLRAISRMKMTVAFSLSERQEEATGGRVPSRPNMRGSKKNSQIPIKDFLDTILDKLNKIP